MKKNIAIGVGIVAGIAGLWLWSSSEQMSEKTVDTPMTTETALFYGQECSHCKEVEKFIAENKIAEKIKFDYIEVWHNSVNKNIFLKKAQECGIAEDKLGVPFLYVRGKCFIGSPEVKGALKQEAGI